MKVRFKPFTSIVFFSFCIIQLCYSQSYKDYLSPKWDSYYDSNPTGIRQNFQGGDFISIIDQVGFIPRENSYFKGDVDLLKKVLLALDYASLRQMSIEGDFYCRSKKHDDYFELYNLFYNKISETTWVNNCPWLLILMSLDDLIKFN